jgi:hypothetical protein
MLDNASGTGDNQSINGNDEPDEVIRMDEVEPINDPNCKHFFIKDSDIIGDYQAWICRKCKRGTFYPINTTIINS